VSITFTALLIMLILCGPKAWAQGPPYQTDDPVPVDLHHYEFYVFGAADGTPVEMDSVGPAFEFNWGALPRVQLHAIFPFGVVAPRNNPAYAPNGIGPTEFGVTDMEVGAKIAFIKESKHVPQVGTFTMFEIPTEKCGDRRDVPQKCGEMRGQTGRSPVFTGSHAEITAAGGLGSEKFFDTFSKSGRKTGNVTSVPRFPVPRFPECCEHEPRG
jgi:hypothetical protein